MVRVIVGPELKKQGKMDGYEWMIRKTGHVKRKDMQTSTGAKESIAILNISFLCAVVIANIA